MLVSFQGILLLVCQLSGILLLLGTLWLLYNRRIYIDKETGQPTQFVVPFLGELKSQNPVLLMMGIAAAMVLIPLRVATVDLITIEGFVETDGKPVTVTLVPVPRFQQTIFTSGPFTLRVPVMPDVNYRAWFTVEKNIAVDAGVDIQQGDAKLAKFTYKEPIHAVAVEAKKEISDAQLHSLGIQ